MKNILNKTYNPKDFEDRIYENWEKNEYFKAQIDESKTPYTIVIPPPNITSNLHIGHALDNTIQDILIRYKRMQGYATLWLPGTDHAAIATEAKIVQRLKEEGTSKEELGRQKFLTRAWEWKEEYGGNIINQLKKMGCSCDWSRLRFTMDEGLSKAVNQVFVNLYNKGLIYKGKRIVNWCPYCKSSISDEEMDYKEETANIWHIRYYSKDKSFHIDVATTRPETMIGDTAVAVHPDDERYKGIVGKTVVLPIVGKEIPIIADEYVEKEFGTGAVKITPAHDPNDFEIGLRHNLEVINVIDKQGKMTDFVPKFKGMDALEVREAIVNELKEKGHLLKVEPYTHNVSKCYRCAHTIEPSISTEWFVKMETLARPAIEAVKKGETKFIPQKFEKTYFHWMENIKDWCISRGIWWGHRIPAHYCTKCNEIHVSVEKPESCTKCGNKEFIQEEATLDTWFSSALWPFSTLGWPEKTEDLKYFYPTNTLVTGYDIITFWVSKMIFSGIEHTGEVPFKDVLIHGLIRDEQGRKMSKSLGNGIDPLELIEEYGADALRFSLVANSSPGMDIRYSTTRAENAKNFANKIFNAAKFINMNIEDDEEIIEFSKKYYDSSKLTYKENILCIEDKWILNRLQNLILEVNVNMDKYELGIALQKIYEFIWNEFCDWYIEMVKPRLYDKENSTGIVAKHVLDLVFGVSMKLLHPFMPFVTDEIYGSLVDYNDKNIMMSSWPQVEKIGYETEASQIELIKEIIIAIRNLRANMNIHPSKKSKIIFVTKEAADAIKAGESFIKKLGFADEIIVQDEKNNIPKGAIALTAPRVEIFIPFEDLVDLDEERKRLEKEKEKCILEIAKVDKMLNSSGFIAKAPEAVIEEAKKTKLENEAMVKQIDERINSMK